jgi:uncharacterized membrane protein YhaH (DUF805 family)
MHWYLDVFKKYAEFNGRARRKEYWMFTLFNFLAIVLLLIVSLIGLWFLLPIYVLAVVIPSLALTIRRLHDTDRSGWWFFIGFVPLVGGIWFFVLMVLEGTKGENQFGPDPKA